MKLLNINKKSCTVGFFCSIFWCVFLNGCSANSSSKTQYYLLNSQVQKKSQEIVEASKQPVISVIVNELPRYLDQANLVMQIDQHQLYYAHHHMWAEPLQQGFIKALLVDLNNGATAISFIDGNQSSSKFTLVIDIERFHVTNTSEVTLAGYYRLTDHVGSLTLNQRTFNLSIELEQDGYSHSVAKLRELVEMYAKHVLAQLPKV